jgi:hypothetical protein
MERYKACVEKIFLKYTLKTKANSHNLDQGCTTQISWRAKKMLLTHSRTRLVKFFSILYSTYIKNQAKCT